MRRIGILFLAGIMVFAMLGCAKESAPEGSQGSEASQYTDALDVMNKVMGVYEEEDLFAMYGGNQENPVMDAPGKFDVSKAEELKIVLGLPESQHSNIDDAASMVHFMNGNIFTGAAYHLKDGADMDAFVDEAKANIQATHWLCGQPDTLMIIKVDGQYVITAYGESGIMETFKQNALSALDGAEVLMEGPAVQ